MTFSTETLDITTGSRPGIFDLTPAVADFCRDKGDGLVNVFVPHATAGLAIIEVGAGSDDDLIDKWSFTISAKDMVLRARAPRANFWGIEYHFESALLSDGEASYKVYFDIVPA